MQGPLLAPLRVTGVGGAFAGYAEGVDAIASNAAAVAVREPFSVSDFDYDLSIGAYLPASIGKTDFDNDGRTGFAYENFVFYTFGFSVQKGAFGVGALGDLQRYDLTPSAGTNDPRVTANVGRLHVVGGATLFDGALTIGAGARIVGLAVSVSTASSSTSALGMIGAAPELGALVHVADSPWRLGATVRAPVEATPTATASEGVARDAAGVERAAGLAVPTAIRMPWEVEIGFALQAGPRPLNPQWIDPGRELRPLARELAATRAARRAADEVEVATLASPEARASRKAELERRDAALRVEEDARLAEGAERQRAERRARSWNWPRERITVLGELLVAGPSSAAVSLESFLSQREHVAGGRATVTPRLGLEGEPVHDRVITRIGTYVEPSRFEGVASRQHFTFGFDVRLGAWSMFGLAGDQVWRFSAVTDLAPRYENLGVSIGAWH